MQKNVKNFDYIYKKSIGFHGVIPKMIRDIYLDFIKYSEDHHKLNHENEDNVVKDLDRTVYEYTHESDSKIECLRKQLIINCIMSLIK